MHPLTYYGINVGKDAEVRAQQQRVIQEQAKRLRQEDAQRNRYASHRIVGYRPDGSPIYSE